MKDFLKQVGATLTGIVIFFIVMGALGLMSLVGMIASSSATTNVKDNSVFVITLDGALDERAETSIMDKLQGGMADVTGLDNLISAIKKAKGNENIKGIYLECGDFAPDSYASLQAIRRELEDFKKSGKFIVAYGDTYVASTYYLASIADKIYMNPQGMFDWHGMGTEMYFLKDAMAKLGLKMQVAKVGTYKSATEIYTENKMSEANREQITAYIGGIWSNVCNAVSKSRGISVANLNKYADEYIVFNDQNDCVKYKFVDELIYADQLKDKVKALMKLGKDDDLNTIGLAAMENVKAESTNGDEIAVYYAYGNIVDKAGGGMLQGQGHLIVGNDVAKDLRDLADNDDVKAIVIRINSGGGSAYASEQMWRAVELAKKKKPVVVSMGGMAASGGYYMGCSANWIVAEPTTLTGSIGIFGTFFDSSELLTQKLGIHFDTVETNAHSAFGSKSRPFNEEELAMLDKYITRGYALFRKRVADGRHLSVEQVEKVAQGRVWLGQDALKIKLVDQLGGLDAAVAKAAQLAKVKEYYASAYPAEMDVMEQLFKDIEGSGDSYLDAKMRAALGDYYSAFTYLQTINNNRSAIQARVPFNLNIR